MNKSSKDGVWSRQSRRVCPCMQMRTNSSSLTEPEPSPNIKQTCGMHTQSHSRNVPSGRPDFLDVFEERMHQKNPLMPEIPYSSLLKPE